MMKFSKTIAIVFLMGTFFLAHAQVEKRIYYADDGLTPRPHSVDFTHLTLNVSFEPEKKLVVGKVREEFKVLQQGVDSLFLDAVNIRFQKVKMDGKDVDYKTTRDGISLHFEEALEWDSEHFLEMEYEANPNKGLYFIGWNDTTERSRKQIWTQGQGINNRHWIPMFDEKNDKLVSELIVEFDEKYKVLSNGKKVKEKRLKNGKKQWHYKISAPHSSYLIMLGIGDYKIDSRKSTSGVPLNFYYYPDGEDELEPTYRYSVEMFDFFEKEIGVPYPWETYSQIPVQDFMYGAMENTTATIFGDFYLVNDRAYLDRNYVRVNAHELAHQWFGDMVTARSSAHHWLQESFATHYDMVIQGEVFGDDHFNWVRRNYNNQALSASKEDLKPIAHSSAGTVRHYPKGAFVLQMLKYVIGRDQFNAGIKHYLEKYAYSSVDSKNLLVAFHERLGLSLNWFWEQWIKKGGEPYYEVQLKQENGSAFFYVKQVHERNDLVGLFKMPIMFEVHFTDGEKLEQQVWVEEQSHLVEFRIPEGKEIDFVLFDPNSEVMKTVTFKKPVEMLLSQAAKAEHMIDRFDAMEELLKVDFPNKNEFLVERFKQEEFHAIKSSILAHLLPGLNEDAAALTRWAIATDSTDVKKAVLNHTVRISDELEPEYRKLLEDSSYEVVEKALELLCFYQPSNTQEYLEMTADEIGNRSKNIRIKWLEIAYARSSDEAYLNELVDYTSPSFEFLCRVNAAKALKRLNVFNEQALTYLLEGSLSFNNRLSGPLQNVIDHFFEQSSYKMMILNHVTSREWDDQSFKKVNKYMIY